MYAELDEEQRALAETVRALLDKRSDSAAVRRAVAAPRGFDEALWTALCQQIGVSALAIPERYGGVGATLLETHVVLEELGRALTPCPLLGSGVLAAQAVLAADDEATCLRLLPRIAEGGIVALVWAGRDGGWEPDRPACVATDLGGSSTVVGEAAYVLDGDIADVLLVLASDAEGIGLYEVDPLGSGVLRRYTASMDPTRRLAAVSFSGAPARRIGHGDYRDALCRVRDLACTALSAEQVGAAARAVELTVSYSKDRRQFGRPIGSFQALKHRMADALVLAESAWSVSYSAARSAACGSAGLAADAGVAKVYCSEALQQIAAEMIQLHGGIAITWEHDAQLYFKRAHSSAQLFGQPREHLARLDSLLDIG